MRTHHEYVVPKSIPITVPMSFFSSFDETAMTARAATPKNADSNLIFDLSRRERETVSLEGSGKIA